MVEAWVVVTHTRPTATLHIEQEHELSPISQTSCESVNFRFTIYGGLFVSIICSKAYVFAATFRIRLGFQRCAGFVCDGGFLLGWHACGEGFF